LGVPSWLCTTWTIWLSSEAFFFPRLSRLTT
jgi:hypothetical protein